ncbi:unnamed protein product, partial [Ectocarpus sp. 4 AP-2014]
RSSSVERSTEKRFAIARLGFCEGWGKYSPTARSGSRQQGKPPTCPTHRPVDASRLDEVQGFPPRGNAFGCARKTMKR